MLIIINERTIINLDNVTKIQRVGTTVNFYSREGLFESYELQNEDHANGLIKNIATQTSAIKTTYS